jgi:O-antigen ligase
VGIIIFGDFLFEQINNYLQNERIFSTISGRAQMWDFVLHSIPKRSWIGFGYSVFKDAFEPTRLLLFYRVPIVHAHNAFMDVLFSTGYLGLITFIFFLTTIYLTIVKETLLSSKRKGIAMLALSASIFIAIRTFTESALNLGFDTWILLTVYYSLEKTRLERWQMKILTKRNSIQ